MATLSGYLRSLITRTSVFQRTIGRTRLLPIASYIHTSKFLLGVAGQQIKMPSLSPTMTEGTIVKWLKKEGDIISPGDILCEIQTDKAIVGFEVEEEGVLAKILIPDDSKDVKIGTVIGIMVDAGEDWKNVTVQAEESSEPVPHGGGVPGIEIKMPSLSPTMTEGTIVKWLKNEGDKFEPGDALCEIQTDKAVVAFEVEDEGILAKIIVPENTQNVQLGTVIALMVNEGDDWKNVSSPAASSVKPATATTITEAAPEVKSVEDNMTQHKLLAPSARLLLQEYGINYSVIKPTGPHDALLKTDVLNYISMNKLKPKEDVPEEKTTLEKTSTKVSSVITSKEKGYVDIPHTSMRRVIAKRLTESKTTIPHQYMSIDCRVDEIIKTRSHLKNEGISVSVNDFVIKCVAESLKRVREVNVVRGKDGAKICNTIDVSVAVATDKGLITPIVKQADTLGIEDISKCVKALAKKAREGRLKPEEFQGGSFTISNLGMFGITEFSAVINPPQGAILAVGCSRQVFSMNSPCTKMTVTLSFDSSIINEVSAARFLKCFKDLIENPILVYFPANIDEKSQ